jgi:hypothetical protein
MGLPLPPARCLLAGPLGRPVATPGSSAQDIFVTPIPNLPFSAVVNVAPAGSTGWFHRLDPPGVEGADTAPGNETPDLRHIHFYDPQTRILTELKARSRTFRTETVSHPP